jgi:hypothetical protein
MVASVRTGHTWKEKISKRTIEGREVCLLARLSLLECCRNYLSCFTAVVMD